MLEVIRECDLRLKESSDEDKTDGLVEVEAVRSKFISKMKDINYTLVINH